jgi:hypothetical protein
MPNRTRSASIVLTLASIGLLAGCVEPIWTAVPGPYYAEEIGVTVDIPKGWSRLGNSKDIRLTKDGFLLNFIQISRTPYGEKYQNTELTIQPGMTELDASQIVLEAMQTDQDRSNLVILDNRPAIVAGSPGFRLEVTYKDANNLTVREYLYVVLTPGSYLVAIASSPDRYYAETMAGDFEKTVASIRIDPPAPSTGKTGQGAEWPQT